MVSQRLLCYEAGEIACIENAMRGEPKEVDSKRKQQHVSANNKVRHKPIKLDTRRLGGDALRNSR